VNWDEIRKEYETSKVTLASLAEKYDIKIGTLKSRKSREGWSRGSPKKDATKKQKKDATIEKKDANKRRGGQTGNSNAKGNSGNQKASAPKQNTNALKHGLFAKNIPKETLDIMESIMRDSAVIDLIWDQIKIQYAAIIRAQRIMFVRDQDDTTKEIKKEKIVRSDSMDAEETEWEIQFAWDKHATFLNAQSRAMSELRSLIKQFDEMANIDDERRLKLEGMKLGIEKTKKEVEKLNSGNDDKPIEILIKRKSERS
jgi:uncharacterized protein YjcR